MKLLEKFIYAVLLFVFGYVLLFMVLHLFNITGKTMAHNIAGITATLLSVGLFLVLIRKK